MSWSALISSWPLPEQPPPLKKIPQVPEHTPEYAALQMSVSDLLGLTRSHLPLVDIVCVGSNNLPKCGIARRTQ
jgi:hypothetical protein